MGLSLYAGNTIPANKGPAQKRGVFGTSFGGLVAVVADVGEINVFRCDSINGGQGGGVWTLDRTITTDLTVGNVVKIGACLDAADGLHYSYVDHSNNVQYGYIAYTGGTYNHAPVVKTLFTYASDNLIPRLVDMDTAGKTTHKHTVVAVVLSNSAGTGSSTKYRTQIYVMDDSSNTIVGSTNYSVNNAQPASWAEDVTIACGKSSDGATEATVNFAVCTTKSFAKDFNDDLRCYQFTIAGASFSLKSTVSVPANGQGNMRRRYWLFCDDTTDKYTLVGAGGQNFWLLYQFTFNGTTSSQVVPFNINRTKHRYSQYTSSPVYFGVSKVSNKVAIFITNEDYAYLGETATINSNNTVTWFNTVDLWDENPPAKNQDPGVVIAGANRVSPTTLNTIIYYSGVGGTAASWRVDAQRLQMAAPTMTKPANAGNATSPFPTLEAKFKLTYDNPQVRYKMRWVIATDAGFTDIVDTLDQPDSALVLPKNTATKNADVRATIGEGTRLDQDTYHVRAYQLDEFGNVSAASAAFTFTIAHPPTATDLAPADDLVKPFSAGGPTFTWTFSDPFADDYQTAYEIEVINNADGTTVVDTGKITSDDESARVAIPSGSKDIELAWLLTVWDSDDVASTKAFGPATFYVSDAPAPSVLVPAAGGVVTSARPTISWDDGVAAAKTQDSYELWILQGSKTLYDSGVVQSTTNSRKLATGIIHNGQSYTIRVRVTDNLGQTGVTNSTFSVAYTPPPATDSLVAFPIAFDTDGFVYLGWDSSSIQANFLQWNLYRQEIGGIGADNIFSTSEVLPVYGYRDTTAQSDTTYLYWVTQEVLDDGDHVESLQTDETTVTVDLETSSYWLLDPLGNFDPVPLFQVVDDTWTDEHEETILTVMNRGRHIDTGTALGANGTLTVQLREKFNGLAPAYNSLANPALQYASNDVDPDKWVFGTTSPTASYRYASFISPSPSSKYNLIYMFSDTLANNSYFGWSNLNNQIRLSKTDLNNGEDLFVSAWYGQPPADAFQCTVQCIYTFYQADGTTNIGSGTLTLSQIDVGNEGWTRYGVTTAIPPTAEFLKTEFRFINSSGASVDNASVYVGGFMVNAGTTAKPYFDGDMRGGIWTNGAGTQSKTDGYYSPRQQREDIDGIKDLDQAVYLRNPFAELLYVSIGDQQGQRIAGVGSSAQADYTLPYREVAY